MPFYPRHSFEFEDSKYLLKDITVPQYLKFKSIDDNYYMEFNNEGILTLYNKDGTQNTIIHAAYGKHLKNTKNRKIVFDGLSGSLHIQGEPSENNDTVSLKYTGKKYIQPYSLILDTSPGNLGKLKILKILSCKYRNCPLRYSLIVNLLSAIYNCDLGIGIATS